MTHPPRPTRSGFTLLELILVLVVVGAVMAVVGPALTRIGRHSRIDQGAHLFMAMLHEGRARAIQEGRPFRLVIDTDDHLVWLEELTAAGYTRPAATYGQVREFDKSLMIDWDGEFTQEEEILVHLWPDGRSEARQIILSDGRGKVRSVYCLSPAEPYRVGRPIEDRMIDQEGIDADAA